MNEQYLIGVCGGLLVGWIFGQFWQSFQDRNLMKIMSQHFKACLNIISDLQKSEVTVANESEEYKQMFNAASKSGFSNGNRTVEEIRDIGREKGEEPVRFHVSRGGGYVTNRDLEEVTEEVKKFRENLLSRSDELEIIHTFEGIIGMGFFPALGIVEEQGYSLHPVYINDGPKNCANSYSGTLLGVKVNDPDYDPAEGQLSKRATITEIVDVGGQDSHNRGVIQI